MQLTLEQLKRTTALMESLIENSLAKSPVLATFDLWDGGASVELEQSHCEGDITCNVYYRYSLEPTQLVCLEVDSFDTRS